MNLKALLNFAHARHAVYLARAAGKPKPWTKDSILQNYRFCNVYRELDKVTIWIRENIREPYANHPYLWFILCMARQINLPDTLQWIIDVRGMPTEKHWFSERVIGVALRREAQRLPVYTGAYMVTCPWPKSYDGPRSKIYWTTNVVLQKLWDERKSISAELSGPTSLASATATLAQYPGWGTFLAAQVVCDLKYTEVLRHAADWQTYAAPGPGSRRGLNRVLGRDKDASWSDDQWFHELSALRHSFNHKWAFEPLHAQDLQNVLCEFDKYERVRLGEGRPRSRYPGSN